MPTHVYSYSYTVAAFVFVSTQLVSELYRSCDTILIYLQFYSHFDTHPGTDSSIKNFADFARVIDQTDEQLKQCIQGRELEMDIRNMVLC